jgi:hypothetical protein
MQNIIPWITAHWTQIVEVYLIIVGAASALVKVFPTLQDSWLLNVIKFLGKYIALNRNAADDDAARAALLKK